MMDANLLKKGEDFDRLPETWAIFITENDIMGKGLSLYPIERCFLGTGERFEDGYTAGKSKNQISGSI